MRFALLPLALGALFAWLLPAAALEIEDHRLFGSPGGPVLRVISTTDTDLLAPLVDSFLAENPGTAVDYTTVSSAELMRAVQNGGTGFDLALSSAMDLQTKLANDGLTRAHASAATALVPEWGNWRNHVFAFSQEPASIVVSPAAFSGLEIPQSRAALISLLRQHPDRFQGRIGTYDVAASGLGYLFATQDVRTSESFWRLAEVFGGLQVRLYCCSGEMIESVASGDLAVAYNVLGSYARARSDLSDRIAIIEPEDYTNMMLRTAVILADAPQPELAGRFTDHLLHAAWSGGEVPEYPFPRYPLGADAQTTPFRPIQLGPGLLVFLDRLKRARFLAEWDSAVQQK